MKELTWKEIVLKGIIAVVLLTGIGGLAVSQVHILTITKLFVREIGFYLFLFVIFGLTTSFNTFLLDKRRGIIFFVLSGWFAAAAGIVYVQLLQADVADQASLALADVQTSFYIVIASIAVYMIASLAVPILSWGNVTENEF